MSSTSPVSTGPRLRAALWSLGALAILLIATALVLDSIVQARLEKLLVMPLDVKNQGVWLMREAFVRRDILPVFGSSELTEPRKNRVEEVFRARPTGFQVCPIGAPGHTTLLMAAKIGSMGEAARGSKVVLIISPSWFKRPGPLQDQMAGCLSPLQAYLYLRSTSLDASLRKRFATRLLDFPDAMAEHPVLAAYAKGISLANIWGVALGPIAKVCEASLVCEDRLAVADAALLEPDQTPPTKVVPGKDGQIPWVPLIKKIEKNEDTDTSTPDPNQEQFERDDREAEYTASFDTSREWEDLVLLLDTLKALDIKPLLIGVPLGATGLNSHGITRTARDHFYKRFKSVCAPYGWPVLDFSDHELDDGFLVKGTSHYTARGWLYVNRAMDDFFHDRTPTSEIAYRKGGDGS